MKKTIVAVVKGFVWSSVFANFVEIFQSNNIKSVLNIVDVFTKLSLSIYCVVIIKLLYSCFVSFQFFKYSNMSRLIASSSKCSLNSPLSHCPKYTFFAFSLDD